MSESIYFDNSLITKPSSRALAEVNAFSSRYWGAVSAHNRSDDMLPCVSQAYRRIYNVLGLKDSDQVVLASSGAESINHVVKSVYDSCTLQDGKAEYIVLPGAEQVVLSVMADLEKRGCVVKYLSTCEGDCSFIEKVENSITSDTAMIVMTAVDGLTGLVYPWEDVVELCNSKGVLSYLEISHAIGRVYLDFGDNQPDFMSFDGENIHSVSSSGLLVVKEGVSLYPLIYGGVDQDGLRAGNLDCVSLIGISRALQEVKDGQDQFSIEVARLRNKLENGLDGKIVFGDSDRAPHIFCIVFKDVNNEALLFRISRKGLWGSIGGGRFQPIACLLESYGFDYSDKYSALSFALSRENTEKEIDLAIEIISHEIDELRKISKEVL